MSNFAGSKDSRVVLLRLRRLCYSALLVSVASGVVATGCSLGDLMCGTECSGGASSCGLYTASNCPTGEGCYVKDECVCTTPGTCTAADDAACAQASSADACNAVGHCGWISACSGSMRPCSDFSNDEDECRSHGSCYWERNCC